MPEISVIINTYNSARFIRKTIASVREQSFQDFELLIVDDGSTDNSLDIVASIQDPRIKIYSYPNGGIARSRNRGLQRASAEFIAFLDHDDLWHEKKLERQWSLLVDNPNASFAYSLVRTIDEQGSMIRDFPDEICQFGVYQKLLTKNFLHTASNPLFRRQHVLQSGGFDENIYGADDWDLFIRLAAQAPVLSSPYHDVYYRIVQGSGSANVEKIEQGCLKVLEKAFDAAPPKFQATKPKSLGIVYQYLCFRTLEEAANRASSQRALRYFQRSREYAPELWDISASMKVLLKSLLVSVLPKRAFRELVVRLKSAAKQ